MSAQEALEELIAAIKATDEYAEYKNQLTKLNAFPDYKEQVDIYRHESFALQNASDLKFENLEQFEKNYSEFIENPIVSDFLEAELNFCKMMQGINLKLAESLVFE